MKSQTRIIDEEIKRYRDKFRDLIKSNEEYKRINNNQVNSRSDVEKAFVAVEAKTAEFKQARYIYSQALEQFNNYRREFYNSWYPKWIEDGHRLEIERHNSTSALINVLYDRMQVLIERMTVVSTELKNIESIFNAENDAIQLLDCYATDLPPPTDIEFVDLAAATEFNSDQNKSSKDQIYTSLSGPVLPPNFHTSVRAADEASLYPGNRPEEYGSVGQGSIYSASSSLGGGGSEYTATSRINLPVIGRSFNKYEGPGLIRRFFSRRSRPDLSSQSYFSRLARRSVFEPTKSWRRKRHLSDITGSNPSIIGGSFSDLSQHSFAVDKLSVANLKNPGGNGSIRGRPLRPPLVGCNSFDQPSDCRAKTNRPSTAQPGDLFDGNSALSDSSFDDLDKPDDENGGYAVPSVVTTSSNAADQSHYSVANNSPSNPTTAVTTTSNGIHNPSIDDNDDDLAHPMTRDNNETVSSPQENDKPVVPTQSAPIAEPEFLTFSHEPPPAPIVNDPIDPPVYMPPLASTATNNKQPLRPPNITTNGDNHYSPPASTTSNSSRHSRVSLSRVKQSNGNAWPSANDRPGRTRTRSELCRTDASQANNYQSSSDYSTRLNGSQRRAPSPPQLSGGESAVVIGTCTAAYSFDGQGFESCYLPFSEGDRFYVLAPLPNEDTSDWLRVSSMSFKKVGFVPTAYVEQQPYQKPLIIQTKNTAQTTNGNGYQAGCNLPQNSSRYSRLAGMVQDTDL